MRRLIRSGLVLGVAASMMWLVTGNPRERSLFKRQFIPGALGLEPGGRDARGEGRGKLAPLRGAFLTRSFYGLDAQSRDWVEVNHLTKPLAFSHAMSGLFPPELFAAHPEFFPWVGGVRYHPPTGAYHWQPDIARQDVAAYAAQKANAFFDANPEAGSFALGVNDGLLFGESPELIALTREGRVKGASGGENAIAVDDNRWAEIVTHDREGGGVKTSAGLGSTPVKPNQSIGTAGIPRAGGDGRATTKAGEQEGTERTEGASATNIGRRTSPLEPRMGGTSSALGSTPVKTDQLGGTGGIPRAGGDGRAATKASEQEGTERTEDARSANTSSGLGSTPVKTDRLRVRGMPRAGGGGEAAHGAQPRWFRGRPDYSNLVFTFTNRVAERVAEKHPDKYVGALAYYWCENAPDVPLHPNVVPFLTADRSQFYDPAFRREELELQERWARAAGTLNIEPSTSIIERSTLQTSSVLGSTPVKPNQSIGTGGIPRAGGDGRATTKAGEQEETERTEGTRATNIERRTSNTEHRIGRSSSELGSTPVKTGQLVGTGVIPRLDGYRRAATKAGEQEGTERTEDARSANTFSGLGSTPVKTDHLGGSGGVPRTGGGWVTETLESRAEPRRRLGLYDYLYGTGFLVPRIWPHALAEHLRHARAAGFTDYFAELSPNWGLDGPMPWLAAQLTLDPFQSVDALLDEYYTRYFREAAEPMRAFFELCERQWMTQPGPAYWLKHWRNDSQAALYPPEVRRRLRSLLDSALAGSVTSRTPERVTLVSDAFALSERFIRRTEASQDLATAALMHAPRERIESALVAYRAAHRELMRYDAELRRRQPLALHPFDWRDFTLSDPESMAQGTMETPGPGLGRELLVDAEMLQPVQPARVIAGLPYGVALPAAWSSRVEPVQDHQAGLSGTHGEPILRISGTRNTSVQQWTRTGGAGAHHARVAVRGRVSSGSRVALLLGWLDAKDRHLGAQRVQLPAGDWPDWVTLEQATVPPPGAVWAGLSLRVEYQVPGDWIEAKEFSLRAK